jgi:oxygen-independent coproporphyrinogen-3 oxidase
MTRPLSLYVHIPFCRAKCDYCDFNSYAGQEHLIPAYARALAQEARLWSEASGGRPVETVYFGGGTPSLVPLDEMRLITGALGECFALAAEAEVSLEANPGTVDEAYLRGLRGLGFNRLSLGVQSFDDGELRALGRIHSAEEAREAYEAARAAGFENVNLDLIFGLPAQAIGQWRRSLEEALALRPEHLSLYALTVEEGTPLAREVAQGSITAPDPDVQADMYTWAEDRLARRGYEHYELSNWALPGRRCRHNLTYWENREYVGLGAGAHSHVDGVRFANAVVPAEYLRLIGEAGASGEMSLAGMRQVVSVERVDEALAMADTLILGLRLVEGVSLSGFRERFGVELSERYADRLGELLDSGLIETADGRLRLTSRGRLLGNEVFQRFLPDA